MDEQNPLEGLDLSTEPATMGDALRMWATMPRALWEWWLMCLAYPTHMKSMDLALTELDDAHGKLTQLDAVRIIRARMDASVQDPYIGTFHPGPFHPLPGENT